MIGIRDLEWVALREDDGRAYLLQKKPGEIKIKGLGRFDSEELLRGFSIGDRIKVGQKSLTIVEAALPEARRNMFRRAQTIGIKDSGFLLSWMGIGVGSRVLEGGHGSAGLAMHIANVLGNNGTLISVEVREEHAQVGKQNMDRLKEILPEFPDWHLIVGDLMDIEEKVKQICENIDAAIIDMAEPWTVVNSIIPILRIGGRIACYCPTTSQLEKSWNACEDAGLEIEWAGEMIERKWSKASKGGVRPGNQPMGHTAFLIIAAKIASEEEE
jgi:tRNA (adenine57-N1/adenine58-N1)-methyltransferase|tara:strand:+ start:2489 stop:3301 length:813 start_codon:yes stop_codon:yes gene_type:complete